MYLFLQFHNLLKHQGLLLFVFYSPSTIAVLPIPGLPVNIADLSGVNKTNINFFNSSSLPIAGLVIYVFEVKLSP